MYLKVLNSKSHQVTAYYNSLNIKKKNLKSYRSTKWHLIETLESGFKAAIEYWAVTEGFTASTTVSSFSFIRSFKTKCHLMGPLLKHFE